MFSFSLFFAFWLNLTSPNTTSYGEVYQVVFVQGTIMNQTKNQAITRGGKISANDKVVFKSKDAKAVVISTTRGRFVLEGKKSKQAGNELVAFVNEVISPLKTNSKLSTRAGESDKVADLEKHFGLTKGVSQFAIVGDVYSFKFTPKENAKLILVIHYNNGTKQKVTSMAFSGSSYDLKKDVYFKEGTENVKFIEIYEATTSKENKKPVLGDPKAGFKPLFIHKEELGASFKEYLAATKIDEALKSYMSADGKMKETEIKAEMDKMSENRKKAELLFYFIQEGYGEINEEGVIDVNKIKADVQDLEKFVKENKL
ncbi:MAG: hypothetical protein EAZ85_12170 [Bacteroidetes bacterium]|nr:MAG: hypothetical protein EAZ85_12170 [Bacteroidota bacterium]TAG85899.1 MAG: hypothetical protein EAZ20_13955 [Bacteroidota bacterium]